MNEIEEEFYFTLINDMTHFSTNCRAARAPQDVFAARFWLNRVYDLARSRVEQEGDIPTMSEAITIAQYVARHFVDYVDEVDAAERARNPRTA
jgi:hypothetical protein